MYVETFTEEETVWLEELTALHLNEICLKAVNPNTPTIPIPAPTSIISVSNEILNVTNIFLQS